MPVNFKTDGKVNPDLENERKKCTFSTEELARYWIGSEQKLEEKRARGESYVSFLILNLLAVGFSNIFESFKHKRLE